MDGVAEPRGPRADDAGHYPEGADRGRGHAPQRGSANAARPGEEEHNSSDDAEQCPDSQRRQDGQKALCDIRDPSLGLLCLGVSGLTGARVAVIGRRSVVMAGVGGRRHGRHGLHCGRPSRIVRQSMWGSSSHAARMVWLHGTRRRADAVSAAAVVPDVALSRVIGCERATYPTNAAGGVVHQACGAKGGAPAGGTPALILSRPDSRLTHAYREQGHGPGVGLVSLVSTCSQRHLSAALRHPSPPPDERSRTERVPRRNY